MTPSLSLRCHGSNAVCGRQELPYFDRTYIDLPDPRYRMTAKEKEEMCAEPTWKRLEAIRNGHVDQLRQPLIGTMSLRMRSPVQP